MQCCIFHVISVEYEKDVFPRKSGTSVDQGKLRIRGAAHGPARSMAVNLYIAVLPPV